MPALKNPRHEAFCLLKAQGKSTKEAYLTAFPDAKSHLGSAPRLIGTPGVKARILEIQEAITKTAVKMSIADKDSRVGRAQSRYDMLHTSIEERFNNKRLRKKHLAVNVQEFAEARQLEEHVAMQLGQWETRPATASIAIQAVIHMPSGEETERKMSVLDIAPIQIESGS